MDMWTGLFSNMVALPFLMDKQHQLCSSLTNQVTNVHQYSSDNNYLCNTQKPLNISNNCFYYTVGDIGELSDLIDRCLKGNVDAVPKLM